MRARVLGSAKRNAALSWRWFLWWRRRYMLLRLALLLIIFAPAVYETFHPTIRDLVIIAIQGIEDASLPTTGYYQIRKIHLDETKRLQKALVKHFDSDRSGRLSGAEARRLSRETGLPTGQVTGRGLKADVGRLLKANQAAGLSTRYRTARELRKATSAAGQAEVARWYEMADKEIAPYLVIQRPRAQDYLHWRTWRRGGQAFLGHLEYTTGIWPSNRGLWFWLALAVIVSVRRFGTGEALQRRFRDDPEMAAGPCPLCGEATHDYGALRQQRLARAMAAGAVTALALWVVLQACWEAWRFLPPDSFPGLSEGPRVAGATALLPVYVGVLVTVLRFLWWPYEVHACHRNPEFRAVGFAAGVVCVVIPLYAIALFCLQTLAHP